MFHLRSSLSSPDLTISMQASFEFTPHYELYLIILTTNLDGLVSVKKAEVGCYNTMSQATNF